MKPNFTLLYRRVAIKEIKEENKTASGIILQDEKNPEVAKGIVVAVGDGFDEKLGKIIPMSLREGMKVMYRPLYGHKYKVNGEEYIFTREDEIMAVIDG